MGIFKYVLIIPQAIPDSKSLRLQVKGLKLEDNDSDFLANLNIVNKMLLTTQGQGYMYRVGSWGVFIYLLIYLYRVPRLLSYTQVVVPWEI